MVDRVCLGNRLGSYGLYVSKPGQDVLSVSPVNMLLSSDYKQMQMLTSGYVGLPSSSYPVYVDIGVPDFGFDASVIFHPIASTQWAVLYYNFRLQYISRTHLRFWNDFPLNNTTIYYFLISTAR